MAETQLPADAEPREQVGGVAKRAAGKSGVRRWIKVLLITGAVFYAGWVGLIYAVQDSLLFPRDMAPKPRGQLISTIDIQTEDGAAIAGWWRPAPEASAVNPAPAVLFFHGNAEIIDQQERPVRMWHRLGVSVLAAEYRGYGRAEAAGKPSQKALTADGVRFFDALVVTEGVDPSRIIIHGYSIGGGVAAQVAAQRKPAALVLEATFASVAEFAWRYGIPPFMARHPFRTIDIIDELNVPIFIAHGRRDMIVPISHARRLHAAVPSATYVELLGGHMDFPGAKPDDPYREQLREFLVGAGVLHN